MGDLDVRPRLIGCGQIHGVNGGGGDRAFDLHAQTDVVIREIYHKWSHTATQNDCGWDRRGSGGGVQSHGLSLTLAGVHFVDNHSIGAAGAKGSSPGAGGGGGGGAGRGGAVFVRGGTFNLEPGTSGCLFEANTATGGAGGGGAVHGGSTGPGGGGGGLDGGSGGADDASGGGAGFGGGGGGGGGGDC